MTKTVAVIAAHPDDEVLGAGGTIARHVSQGDMVHVAFLADGVGARGTMEGLRERRSGAEKALETLGVKDIHFFSLPDNKMDSIPLLEVVQVVESLLDVINPHIIYTHHSGDLNVDHRVTHQAILTACRPFPDTQVEAIYGFEVLSSTEWASPNIGNMFVPLHYVNISNYIKQKQKALSYYDYEMRDFPHARSYEAVEALATMRGVQVGLEYAEAFSVIREVVR